MSEEKISGEDFQDPQRQELFKAMGKLPKLQAEAVALKFCSGFDNGEVAKILGKSDTACRILLSRGTKRLKEILT